MQVYLMRVSGTQDYKIGVSVDAESRRRAVQTGNPHPVELVCVVTVPGNGRREEAFLHAEFDEQRLCGEWFDLTGEQAVECITCMTELAPNPAVPAPERPPAQQPLPIIIEHIEYPNDREPVGMEWGGGKTTTFLSLQKGQQSLSQAISHTSLSDIYVRTFLSTPNQPE